jgi:hypothetical protein
MHLLPDLMPQALSGLAPAERGIMNERGVRALVRPFSEREIHYWP